MSSSKKTKKNVTPVVNREEVAAKSIRARQFGGYTELAAIVFSVMFRNRNIAADGGISSLYPTKELDQKKEISAAAKMALIERVTKDSGYRDSVRGLARILLGLKPVAAKTKTKTKKVEVKTARVPAYKFILARTSEIREACRGRFDVPEIKVNKKLSPMGQEVELFLAKNSFGCQQTQVCNLMSEYLGEKIQNLFDEDDDDIDGISSDECRPFGLVKAGNIVTMVTHISDDHEVGIDIDGDATDLSDLYCELVTDEEVALFINRMTEKNFNNYFGMIARK